MSLSLISHPSSHPSSIVSFTAHSRPASHISLLCHLQTIIMERSRSLVPLAILLGAIAMMSDAFAPLANTHHVNLHQKDASHIKVHMAKSKSATKRKNSSQSNVSSLKGFGAPSSAATASSGVSIDRSKSALAFYDYIAANGGESNLKRVGLGEFPLPGTDLNIRGVVALQDIRKGDPIIEIPYEMALDFGRQSVDPTLPATSFLQMYCQWKSGQDIKAGVATLRSQYIGDYFAMLPAYQSVDCLGSTDFFSDEALEMLQSPLVKEETLLRRDLVKARYERDIETMAAMSSNLYRWGEDGFATFSHLQWATWLITSRVLTVQARESDTGATVPHRLFIPLIDMCNHDRDSPHILSGRAEPGGMLKVMAGKDVQSGDAIDISYGGGVEGNDRFIQDYGFLDSGGSKERAGGTAVAEAYRLVAKKLLDLGKKTINSMGRLSIEDQKRSLEALKATTISEDEALLASDKVIKCDERAALVYRIGIKKAIQELTD